MACGGQGLGTPSGPAPNLAPGWPNMECVRACERREETPVILWPTPAARRGLWRRAGKEWPTLVRTGGSRFPDVPTRVGYSLTLEYLQVLPPNLRKQTNQNKKTQKTGKRVLKYIFKCLLKVEHFSIWPKPPTFRFLCGSHAQCLIGFCHNERARLASAIPFPWASHWPGSFFPLALLCHGLSLFLILLLAPAPGFCPHKKMSWTFRGLCSRVFYTPLSSLNNQRNKPSQVM